MAVLKVAPTIKHYEQSFKYILSDCSRL